MERGNLGNTLRAPIEGNSTSVEHEQYFIDRNSTAVGGYILKIETKSGVSYYKKLLIK